MALIEYTLLGIEDKVKTSIEALKTFEPEEGYYLAFSGGKDSVVVKALCDMAGVKYDAHYNVTSVDPPELVQFIKEYHKDVIREIPRDSYGNAITMWNLIPRKLMPPTQLIRYCCNKLKEEGGYRRFVITGVRWAESTNRKNNHGLVTVMGGSKSEGIILNNDNLENRRFVESCYQKKKTVLNPIINWEDDDVWEFIHKYDIPYCKLYDEGLHRIGCIGCPMANYATRSYQLERWPTYKRAYLRAFDEMLKRRIEHNLEMPWSSSEEVMEWWLRKLDKKDSFIEGQVEINEVME